MLHVRCCLKRSFLGLFICLYSPNQWLQLGDTNLLSACFNLCVLELVMVLVFQWLQEITVLIIIIMMMIFIEVGDLFGLIFIKKERTGGASENKTGNFKIPNQLITSWSYQKGWGEVKGQPLLLLPSLPPFFSSRAPFPYKQMHKCTHTHTQKAMTYSSGKMVNCVEGLPTNRALGNSNAFPGWSQSFRPALARNLGWITYVPSLRRRKGFQIFSQSEGIRVLPN